jgi:sorting nexin-3/12
MATETAADATRRLNVKKQTLDDAYAAPANFLEIDVVNPITHGVGKKRYSDYEVRMKVHNNYQHANFPSVSAFFKLPL